MATPYLAEIRVFSFGFAPKGWALCNGQTLAINQNQALFALLGTTYRGNGTTTFQLPNLQARMPVHMGNGFTEGQLGGEMNHTLITSEMPSHSHTATGGVNECDRRGSHKRHLGGFCEAPLRYSYKCDDGAQRAEHSERGPAT
jgi:microcystin-dependent protein